jgi:hypothetical protein
MLSTLGTSKNVGSATAPTWRWRSRLPYVRDGKAPAGEDKPASGR